MVHRAADSRLLTNLLQQEKEYTKQLNQVLDTSNISLASFAAYAAASPPPTSHVIMAVTASLAAADEALRLYVHGVEEWRDSMRLLKDAEDEVGNIMRDREILVTRMIKASKSHKSGSSNFRDSLLLGNQRFPSSSSLSLSFNANQDSPSPPPSRPLSGAFSSSKLAAAQTELQACETHLAAKERELDAKRCAAVRDGLGARVKAMMDCGWAWSQHGKEALRALDDLKVENLEHHKSSFIHESYLEDARFNSLKIPEPDSTRPSSDFSSIGPSQSASQVNINHEHLPPPVHIGSIMNSGLFGDPTPRSIDVNQNSSNNENMPHAQDQSQSGPRPPSGISTTASSISATPATYKVETMTYAPAVAVHVSGRDVSATGSPSNTHIPISSELFKDDNLHTSVRIPAPHALEGYAFDIPTAERPVAGPSGQQQQRNRSIGTPPVSGRSTPQPASVVAPQPVSSYPKRHVLERRITEEELRRSLEERQSVDDRGSSTEEEVKTEKKLVQEGKLAIVENPRFMTEARRKELEKEKEKTEIEKEKVLRMEEEKRAKAKAKEADDEVDEAETRKKEKKKFSFFHSPSNSQNPRLPSTSVPLEPQPDGHVTFASPRNVEEHLPKSPSVSPGKKGFFGSIKGFFGSKQSSELGQSSPSPSKSLSRRANTDVDVSDSDEDEGDRSPTTRSGGLQGLFRGNTAKDKDKERSSSNKWETRTDKNIRQLARRESFDDGSLSRPGGGSGLGGGLAGRVVASAGIVNATEVGVGRAPSRGGVAPRGRAASDVGHGSSSTSNLMAAGRRLKKTRAGPPVSQSAIVAAVGGVGVGSDRAGVSSTESLSITDASRTGGRVGTKGKEAKLPTRAASPSTAATDKGKIPAGPTRRSASVDVNERRKSWVDDGEDEGTSSGGGMIVDLGRRRRRVSSEVGGVAAAAAAGAGGKVDGGTHTRATSVSTPVRQAEVVRQGMLKPTSTDYSSDTAATVSAPAVTRKKSLTKKKPEGSASAAAPPPVPVVSNSVLLSTPLKATNASTSTLTSMPTKKSSVKSSATPTTTATKSSPSSDGAGTATVLAANGDNPSGTLVSQPGWNAQALAVGGGLSRNSSVISSASAPSGPTAGRGKKQTSLGQGMGGGGGLGRRSLLGGSSPSTGKSGAHSVGANSSTNASGGSVVQATPSAPSLMSIVEDVTRSNREGWNQDSMVKKSVGGSQRATGVIEVVKAPPPVGRDVLNAMDTVPAKTRATRGSTTAITSSTSKAAPKTGMFEIRAPGSVFDQKPQVGGGGTLRETEGSATSLAGSSPRPIQTSTPKQDQAQARMVASNAAGNRPGPAKTPLRSAMRNTSRTPSPAPVAGPSMARHHEDVNRSIPPPSTSRPGAVAEKRDIGHLPPPVQGTLPWGADGTLQSTKGGKDKSKGKTPARPVGGDLDDDSNTTDSESYETGNEYYSEEEVVGRVVVATKPTPVANGHPVGYENSKKASSDASHSTTSTLLVDSSGQQMQTPTPVQHPGIISNGSGSQTPRRRKSVRVSLQPTFSPSPPAIEYDYEEEQTRYSPWGGREVDRTEEKHTRQASLPAPIPVRAPATRQKVDAHDMWQDSGSDEDEEYAKAKRLLTRAAKREKDVNLLVANRV